MRRLQVPLDVIVRQAEAFPVLDVIEDDKVVFAGLVTQPATVSLHLHHARLRGAKPLDAIDAGYVKPFEE